MTTHLSTYVALVHHSERTLAEAFETVADGHGEHPDVVVIGGRLAAMSRRHVAVLEPVVQRYGEDGGSSVAEPERLRADGLDGHRTGPIGLLRDLQDVHLLATLVQSTWTVVAQGAQGLRDEDLLDIAHDAQTDTGRQLSWLVTRMKSAAPQALIVPQPTTA